MLRFCDGIETSPRRLMDAYGDTFVALGYDILARSRSAAINDDFGLLRTLNEWKIVYRPVPVLVGNSCQDKDPRALVPISEIQMLSKSMGVVRCTTGWYRLGDAAGGRE
ncbi:hypothetical protein GGQ73_002993 [Rhizobium skierniewicense]|uniref:Uncharacterized protein n=1 Tax=Rhizobium skierniewicense TaxID=984260 RepID=A0A7W6G309_9HYPH|nr:hypothetical protein [Rhizobium skierniewicense]MBB3947029.1 hypothetical protein [Rhizobium skierniewicense]